MGPCCSSRTTKSVTVGKAAVVDELWKVFADLQGFSHVGNFLELAGGDEFNQGVGVGYGLQSVKDVLYQLDQSCDCLDNVFNRVFGFDKLLFQRKAFRY